MYLLWQGGGESCVLGPSQAARLAQLRHLHLAGVKLAAPLQEQHEPRLGGSKGGSKGRQGQQQGQTSLGQLLLALPQLERLVLEACDLTAEQVGGRHQVRQGVMLPACP